MIVNFSGTDRIALVKAVSATRTLGGRAICDIELVPQQISGAFVPFVGQPIEVISGGAYLFSGSVESVKQSKFTSTSVVAYSVSCADHHRILDRRLTGQREWVNTTARTIIGDICNTNLTDENVDGVTYVNDGATVDRFAVDYGVTVGEAINELAKISQYHWYIDASKQIRFFNQGSTSAPFMLAAPCLNASKIEQTSSREGYSNKLIVRLSTYIREVQTARFTSMGRIEENGEEADSSQQTDGSRKFFAVTFQIVQMPRVWVDGNEETVGIDGVDSGKSWYWSKGSQSVRQDDAQTPVPAVSTLYVEYIGQQTVTVSVQNNTEIDARQIIESNSGIYEGYKDSAARVTGETANDYAQSLLDQVDEHSITTTVDTDDYHEPACISLSPGDTIQIATAGYVAGYYIVRQIRYSAPSRDGDGDVDCQFECVKGPILGDAVTFFQSLAQSEGIVATPGPMTSPADEIVIPEPVQPDGTGWSIALGTIQPRAYTNEPEQRIDITITRDLTANSDYWEIWARKSGEAPTVFNKLSEYPSATVVEIWRAQESAAFDYDVVLRGASASYSGIPPDDSAPWKTVTIPAITAAPAPTSWSVTLEYSSTVINGFYRGRYAFTATLPVSANNAAIVTEIRPHAGGDWGKLSGYQTDPTTAMQAGGAFSWDQGEFSPESWEKPESPMQWDIRLGVEDHRGIVTWHSTINVLTITAGGGFQVSALDGKFGSNVGLVNGVIEGISSTLLDNGGFEQGLLGWTTAGMVETDSSTKYSGTYSAKLTLTGLSSIAQSRAALGSQTYKLLLRAKTNASSGTCVYAIAAYDSSGSPSGTPQFGTIAAGLDWHEAAVKVLTTGSSTASLYIVVYGGPASGGVLWVDMVELTREPGLSDGMTRDSVGRIIPDLGPGVTISGTGKIVPNLGPGLEIEGDAQRLFSQGTVEFDGPAAFKRQGLDIQVIIDNTGVTAKTDNNNYFTTTASGVTIKGGGKTATFSATNMTFTQDANNYLDIQSAGLVIKGGGKTAAFSALGITLTHDANNSVDLSGSGMTLKGAGRLITIGSANIVLNALDSSNRVDISALGVTVTGGGNSVAITSTSVVISKSGGGSVTINSGGVTFAGGGIFFPYGTEIGPTGMETKAVFLSEGLMVGSYPYGTFLYVDAVFGTFNTNYLAVFNNGISVTTLDVYSAANFYGTVSGLTATVNLTTQTLYYKDWNGNDAQLDVVTNVSVTVE